MCAKIFVGMITLCMASASFGYIVDGSRINRPSLLSYAKSKLQNRGTIEQSADGLAYLNVPESYIKELYKQIHLPGFELPTHAQVSIINEIEAKTITTLQELGQTIQFKPLGFYTIVVDDQEYFMLAIDAPELQEIRKKYGLSEQLDNHAFTVPIGVKKLVAHNELG